MWKSWTKKNHFWHILFGNGTGLLHAELSHLGMGSSHILCTGNHSSCLVWKHPLWGSSSFLPLTIGDNIYIYMYIWWYSLLTSNYIFADNPLSMMGIAWILLTESPHKASDRWVGRRDPAGSGDELERTVLQGEWVVGIASPKKDPKSDLHRIYHYSRIGLYQLPSLPSFWALLYLQKLLCCAKF